MDDNLSGYASFRGEDGREAEEFIQAVRKAAFDANKDRDNEWMARFASTCMSGKALRWYESLDDDVQESWKRLKKAILDSYPPADGDSIIPSPSAAPAAPAAAPPPAAPETPSFPQVYIAPPAAVPPQSSTRKPPSRKPPSQKPPPAASPQAAAQRAPSFPADFIPAPSGSSTSRPVNKPFDDARGIIEIWYAETNRLMGVISRTPRGNGAAQVIRSGQLYEEAQVYVENKPSSIYSNIGVATGVVQITQFIGLTWVHQKSARAPAGYRYAAAVFTEGSDGSSSSINSNAYKGRSEAAIWDIASDGKMTATSGGKRLAFYVFYETKQINIFPDFNSYVTSRGVAHQWDRVNLIFRKHRYF